MRTNPMKCKIQWVDENGKPTPDENEAIGHVQIHAYNLVGAEYANGCVRIPDSERFPICAAHKAEYDRDKLNGHHWAFYPL